MGTYVRIRNVGSHFSENAAFFSPNVDVKMHFKMYTAKIAYGRPPTQKQVHKKRYLGEDHQKLGFG